MLSVNKQFFNHIIKYELNHRKKEKKKLLRREFKVSEI